MTDEILHALISPEAAIGMISFLLIAAGIIFMRGMKPASPLAPYVLQILVLTFILPVVILITIIIDVDGEAIMGLLGTIVGYIFGTSRLVHQELP